MGQCCHVGDRRPGLPRAAYRHRTTGLCRDRGPGLTAEGLEALPAARRRRLIGLGLFRSVLVTAALVTLYYVVPLKLLTDLPFAIPLMVGVVLLAGVSIYQLRAVIRASFPGIRAVESLATTAPLFILLFASVYYVMAESAPGNFSTQPLTRTDTLYFTMTVFTTVGFGDITATSEAARLIVMSQMGLDLIVLGLGLRLFVGAVQVAREQHKSSGA